MTIRIAAALFFFIVAGAVSGADYPTRPVRWIVTVPPGGGTDFIARLYATKSSETLGQPIVVDNRPGATGIVGMEIVSKAPADGYTALMISPADLIITSVQPRPGLDLTKDFTPVSLLGMTPLVLVVHPSVNARNLQEFVSLARSQPGKLNYASGGTGGIQHLATELFKHEAKINITHVPYKGTGPGMVDLLAGNVQATLTSTAAAIPQVKAGKLRALAMMGSKRSPAAPDVPTFAELGLPNVNMPVFYGVLVPAGTPRDVIDRLAKTIAAAGNAADVREKIVASGAEPLTSTPAEFGKFLRSERDKIVKIARDVNLKLE